MPARKKDPSVRSRRNKAPTRATLVRPLHLVRDWSALTVSELRDEIDAINESRPADQQVPKSGSKAELVERIEAALSPVPPMPTHPPTVNGDGEVHPVDWHPQTVAWWHDVWTSPMMPEWDDSDIHNVALLALIYDDSWTATTPKARKESAAEFRQQRQELGLSPYARRRLEWTIETAEAAKDQGNQRRAKSGASHAHAPAPSQSPPVDPRLVLAE